MGLRNYPTLIHKKIHFNVRTYSTVYGKSQFLYQKIFLMHYEKSYLLIHLTGSNIQSHITFTQVEVPKFGWRRTVLSNLYLQTTWVHQVASPTIYFSSSDSDSRSADLDRLCDFLFSGVALRDLDLEKRIGVA